MDTDFIHEARTKDLGRLKEHAILGLSVHIGGEEVYLCHSLSGWVRNAIAPVVPPLHWHGFQLSANILCCVPPAAAALLRPKL